MITLKSKKNEKNVKNKQAKWINNRKKKILTMFKELLFYKCYWTITQKSKIFFCSNPIWILMQLLEATIVPSLNHNMQTSCGNQTIKTNKLKTEMWEVWIEFYANRNGFISYFFWFSCFDFIFRRCRNLKSE